MSDADTAKTIEQQKRDSLLRSPHLTAPLKKSLEAHDNPQRRQQAEIETEYVAFTENTLRGRRELETPDRPDGNIVFEAGAFQTNREEDARYLATLPDVTVERVQHRRESKSFFIPDVPWRRDV